LLRAAGDGRLNKKKPFPPFPGKKDQGAFSNPLWAHRVPAGLGPPPFPLGPKKGQTLLSRAHFWPLFCPPPRKGSFFFFLYPLPWGKKPKNFQNLSFPFCRGKGPFPGPRETSFFSPFLFHQVTNSFPRGLKGPRPAPYRPARGPLHFLFFSPPRAPFTGFFHGTLNSFFIGGQIRFGPRASFFSPPFPSFSLPCVDPQHAAVVILALIHLTGAVFFLLPRR